LRAHGDIVNIMASMEVLDLLNALDLDAISLDDLKTLRRDGGLRRRVKRIKTPTRSPGGRLVLQLRTFGMPRAMPASSTHTRLRTMSKAFLSHLAEELDGLKSSGLYKSERIITSKQAGTIDVASGARVLNFCANNYLGLADNAELIEAGKQALDRYGYGMASVRFICGTQEEHKQLEARISSFLGMQDTILYSS
jgi:hypothetical protein